MRPCATRSKPSSHEHMGCPMTVRPGADERPMGPPRQQPRQCAGDLDTIRRLLMSYPAAP
jgi:hypothetical protein